MKIKTFIFVLTAGVFLLSACQKNIDIFIPDPGQQNGPDTSWHVSISSAMPVSVLKNNLLDEPYQDSIIVNANTATVLSPSGLQVTFPPNSCATSTGQAITGKVSVEIFVVKKKGDMIRLNKPSTANDSMMVTAGEIFIMLKKDGQVVQLAPNVKINIRYVDPPINPQMKFFVGDESNTQNFNWLPNPDLANNYIAAGTQAYEIFTNRLRWISVAYVYDIGSTAKVNVTADIPTYFTNSNTIAFTVFKDFRSVVAMHGDLSARKFISGKLPVGKQITVVIISKLGDDYYLGYESAITQVGTSLNQVVHVVPVKKSFSQILSYLSTL